MELLYPSDPIFEYVFNSKLIIPSSRVPEISQTVQVLASSPWGGAFEVAVNHSSADAPTVSLEMPNVQLPNAPAELSVKLSHQFSIFPVHLLGSRLIFFFYQYAIFRLSTWDEDHKISGTSLSMYCVCDERVRMSVTHCPFTGLRHLPTSDYGHKHAP